MTHKLPIDDHLTLIDKPQKTSSSLHTIKKANDALSKITESLFSQFKQSSKNPKRKNYKTNYDFLIAKPKQIKALVINDDNKNKRNQSKETLLHWNQNSQLEKSISHSRNIIESQSESVNNALNANYNFISHNKHKSTGLFINNTFYLKDKGRKGNKIGIGQDATRNCSKEKHKDSQHQSKAKNSTNAIKLKLNLKGIAEISNNNKKNMIKNYLLNNYGMTTCTSGNVGINNSKQSDKSALDDRTTTSTFQIKKNEHQQTNSNTNNNHKISRSSSISNLDQTTKTSTEATTTTSKRLYDQILKSTSNKPSIKNMFNTKMNNNQNFSSFSLSHLSKPLYKKTTNKRNKHLNNSILNQLQMINKTMTNQHQLNLSVHNNQCTTTEVNECNTNTITKPLLDGLIQSNGNKLRLNDTGSLSLLSEDSVFNYSKHRSTSGNNNNNSLAYQNDSISFKRSSHKHSSNNNSNTIDKRSLSKDKLSSENNEVDPTVSYTYSDDGVTERKSRKTRRNVQRAFNNEDFLTFYTQMNQKLFGYNNNVK